MPASFEHNLIKNSMESVNKQTNSSQINNNHHHNTRSNTNSVQQPSQQSMNPVSPSKDVLQVTRFPSLTFISAGPNLHQLGETRIKNANLKSELIEEISNSKKSKDLLFTTITAATINNNNNRKEKETISEAEILEDDDIPNINSTDTTNITIIPSIINQKEIDDQNHSIFKDDNNSMYQNSLYSTNINQNMNHNINHNHNNNENEIHNNNENINDLHSYSHLNLSSTNNINNINNKIGQRNISENESFIYNDVNSITNGADMLNIVDQVSKHRKFSINQNSLKHIENELEFLDLQSISTTATANGINNNRSPSIRRIPILSHINTNNNNNFNNNLSISPKDLRSPNIISQVRKVSMKLFNNQNLKSLNEDNSSIIKNNTKNQHKKFNSGFEYNYEEDETDFVYDNEFNDAESYLAKPFKNSNNNNSNKNNKSSNNNNNNSNSKHYGTFNNSNFHNHGLKNNSSIANVNNQVRYFDENQFNENSPHDYKSMYYKQNLILKIITTGIYFFLILSVLLITFRLFILKNFDNNLINFEIINLDNVLVSDEVLLFEIQSQAININFQDINIWEMNLDIFLLTDETNLETTAYSNSISNSNSNPNLKSNDLTILLGNSLKFLTPLHFDGIISSCNTYGFIESWKKIWKKWSNKDKLEIVKSNAQIKILHPGKNFTYNGESLTREQWLKILNSSFKLIIRGSFNYRLPLVLNDNIISINSEVEIKPNLSK